MAQQLTINVATLNKVGAELHTLGFYNESMFQYKQALELLIGALQYQDEDSLGCPMILNPASVLIQSYRESSSIDAHALPLPYPVLDYSTLNCDMECWQRLSSMTIMYNMALVHFDVKKWDEAFSLWELALSLAGYSAEQLEIGFDDLSFVDIQFLQIPQAADLVILSFHLLGRLAFLKEQECKVEGRPSTEGDIWLTRVMDFLLKAVQLGQTLLGHRRYMIASIFATMGESLVFAGYTDEGVGAYETSRRLTEEADQESFRDTVIENKSSTPAAPAA